eukprot:scaffold58402_cov31-Prasinocladus_malaysianus.AAC.1
MKLVLLDERACIAQCIMPHKRNAVTAVMSGLEGFLNNIHLRTLLQSGTPQCGLISWGLSLSVLSPLVPRPGLADASCQVDAWASAKHGRSVKRSINDTLQT